MCAVKSAHEQSSNGESENEWMGASFSTTQPTKATVDAGLAATACFDFVVYIEESEAKASTANMK